MDAEIQPVALALAGAAKTAVVLVLLVVAVCLVVAASVWLSRRSPAALSAEEGRPGADPRGSGGTGRPAGPDAEAEVPPTR